MDKHEALPCYLYYKENILIKKNVPQFSKKKKKKGGGGGGYRLYQLMQWKQTTGDPPPPPFYFCIRKRKLLYDDAVFRKPDVHEKRTILLSWVLET